MDKIKFFLELISLASTPIIAVIAYFALGQIKIAKEQLIEQKKALKISSKRDSLKLTADQVSLYCNTIIPLQNIFEEKKTREHRELLNSFKIDFEDNAIKVTPPKQDVDFTTFIQISKELVAVANAMESFSTYFVSGVADEKIAYLSLGSTFCDTMNKMAPILIPLSNGGRRFSSVLDLYSIWGSRLNSENLLKQKTEIENKLKTHSDFSIKVVGTGN